MEKGINAYIKEQFAIEEVDIKTYSPLTLAYIGDGIYDLVIRSVVVDRGNTKAAKLHQTMSDYRRATGFEALMGYLYLKDEFGRIVELVKCGLSHYDIKTGKTV